MTEHAAPGTRPAQQRRPGSRQGPAWLVPAALIAITLIPLVAGSLRLLEIAGGPQVGTAPSREVLTMPNHSRAPTHYDLRITGHLDPHWSSWFGGSEILHRDDGTTVVRCVVTDQAELHGLLVKIRDLGATLVSVTPVDGGCYLW